MTQQCTRLILDRDQHLLIIIINPKKHTTLVINNKISPKDIRALSPTSNFPNVRVGPHTAMMHTEPIRPTPPHTAITPKDVRLLPLVTIANKMRSIEKAGGPAMIEPDHSAGPIHMIIKAPDP